MPRHPARSYFVGIEFALVSPGFLAVARVATGFNRTSWKFGFTGSMRGSGRGDEIKMGRVAQKVPRCRCLDCGQTGCNLFVLPYLREPPAPNCRVCARRYLRSGRSVHYVFCRRGRRRSHRLQDCCQRVLRSGPSSPLSVEWANSLRSDQSRSNQPLSDKCRA